MNQVLIIGNAPSVLQHKLGAVIDTFPLVVRFNNFVVYGFEDFVGTKTDAWVATFKASKYQPSDFKNVYFVHPPFLMHSNPPPQGSNITLISGEDYDRVNKLIGLKNEWASSGVVMIYYFLGKDYQVIIHGFDFFQTRRIHYYQDNACMIGHNASKERDAVQKLIENNEIQLLTKYATQHNLHNSSQGRI